MPSTDYIQFVCYIVTLPTSQASTVTAFYILLISLLVRHREPTVLCMLLINGGQRLSDTKKVGSAAACGKNLI